MSGRARSRRTVPRTVLGALGAAGLALLLASPVPVRAADDPFPPEGRIDKVQRKIEAYRARRITSELGFDEKTNARLLDLLRQTDRARMRLEAENRDALRLLRRELAAPAPDPGRVGTLMGRLAENHRQVRLMEEQHLQRLGETLPPVDAARFLLFDLEFQREIRDRVFVAVKERKILMRGDINQSAVGCTPGAPMKGMQRGRPGN